MPTEHHGTELDKLYTHLWSLARVQDSDTLDPSLKPRSPAFLYEIAAAMNLQSDAIILDVGCGLGNHARELAQRSAARIAAMDLVNDNVATARAETATAGLHKRIDFYQGSIEDLPFRSATFDLVWCRDMLPHIRPLQQALAECARVLRPGGSLLIHTTFATSRLQSGDLDQICLPLEVIKENLHLPYFEAALPANLELRRSEAIGSEFVEFTEEHDQRCSRQLLRLSRLLRQPQHYIATMGESSYRIALAVYHWNLYEFIGRLSPHFYLLQKYAPGR